MKGTFPIVYHWFYNGSRISYNTSVIMIPNASFIHAGHYVCEVSNVAGGKSSAAVTLTYFSKLFNMTLVLSFQFIFNIS